MKSGKKRRTKQMSEFDEKKITNRMSLNVWDRQMIEQ